MRFQEVVKMNLSKKIVRAKEVKIAGPKKRVSGEFVPMDFNPKSGAIIAGSQERRFLIEKNMKESGREIDILKKKAYNKGFSEGSEEGKNGKRKEFSSAFGIIEKLIEELRNFKKELVKESEKELVTLAFTIAEKIIRKEVSTDREIISMVLSDAIRNVQNKEEMRIKLNSRDYDYIMEAGFDDSSNSCDMESLKIEKDEQIEQGGAIIETPFGVVDARLDQQLDRIRESLE